MGGVLADPVKTLPGLFGAKAVFGFQWIHDYPYALPSLINSILLTMATAIVFLFLEEVRKRHTPCSSHFAKPSRRQKIDATSMTMACTWATASSRSLSETIVLTDSPTFPLGSKESRWKTFKKRQQSLQHLL